MTPDFVNGLFEALAAVFILNHCRVLFADKRVLGMSTVSTIFFTAWGFWNIFYYPHLDQWWSFVGGLFVVSSNCLWVGMQLYYGRAR